MAARNHCAVTGTTKEVPGPIFESKDAPIWFKTPHVHPLEETYISPRQPQYSPVKKVYFKPATVKLEESPRQPL